MTRILITGASGFLGHNLVVGLCARHEVFAGYLTNRPEGHKCTAVRLDVTKANDVLSCMEQIRPELVVHSAAMSQPDECEREPERAQEVIVDGTRNVAAACRRTDARLLHVSTDLVFDGKRGLYTEEDEVQGISVYSRAKIDAERAIQSIAPLSILLRVALLFGVGSAHHPGSVAAIVRTWHVGRALTFYTDQYRTPTYAPQVMEAVEKIIERPGTHGILHLGGADRVSRFEFAVSLAERAGIPLHLVRPGSMFDFQGAAPRGADCSLVSQRIQEVLGIRPLHCSEALDLMDRDGIFQRLRVGIQIRSRLC